MKVLLDENLPHDLRHFLPGHEVVTVAYLGWQGLTNGELLSRAAMNGFEAMLSKDAGIEYEQNLSDLPLSVILIEAPSNALDAIRPIVPDILKALESLHQKTLVRVPT